MKGVDFWQGWNQSSGSLIYKENYGFNNASGGTVYNNLTGNNTILLDASRSSPYYGKTDYVRPQSIGIWFIIKY